MSAVSTNLTSRRDNITKELSNIAEKTTSNVDYLDAKLKLIRDDSCIGKDNEIIHITNITNIDIKRDYINAIADEIHVTFLFGLGDLVYDILPFRQSFKARLILDNLDGNGNLFRKVEDYKVIVSTGTPDGINPEVQNISKEKLNAAKTVNVTITLVPIDFLLIESKEMEIGNLKTDKEMLTSDFYRAALQYHFANSNITYNGKKLGSDDFPLYLDINNVHQFYYTYFEYVKKNFGEDKLKAEKSTILSHFTYEKSSDLESSTFGSMVKSVAEFLDVKFKKLRGTPLTALNSKGFIRKDDHELYPVPPGTYLQKYYRPKGKYGGEYLKGDEIESHEALRTIFVYPFYQTVDPFPYYLNKVNSELREIANDQEANSYLSSLDINNMDPTSSEYQTYNDIKSIVGEENIQEYIEKAKEESKKVKIPKIKPYIKCFIANDNVTFSLTDKTYWYEVGTNSLNIIAGVNTSMSDYTDPKNLMTPEIYNVLNIKEAVSKGTNIDTSGDDVQVDPLKGTLQTPTHQDPMTDSLAKGHDFRRISLLNRRLKDSEGNTKEEVQEEEVEWYDIIGQIKKGSQAVASSLVEWVDPGRVETVGSILDIEAEALSRNLIHFDIEWKFGNPDLIYPGMPISIYKFIETYDGVSNPYSTYDIYVGRVIRTYTSYSVVRKSIVTKIHCLCLRKDVFKEEFVK